MYRRSFITRVHQLVAMGYEALDPKVLTSADETDITGQLVAAINDVLNARQGPAWRSHFAVKDDPPVGRKGGRARPRVDIEFERTSPSPRPHYQFEAKRLHSNRCIGRYLGAEGLRCFITKRYAAADLDAGMLGYVQKADNDAWAMRIQKRLLSSRADYQMRAVTTPWPTESLCSGAARRFHSTHIRKGTADIAVSHTLLRFY